MPKFNMGDVGGGVAAPSEMKWVYLNDIVPNERNEKIYTTEIGSLAEDILTHGLLQAPLVHPIGGGKYKIISGHRRVLALKKLAEAGNSEFNKIKVVIDNDTDEISLALKLISANAENRILSNAELLAQTQEYMVLLAEWKKKEGMPGKVRDMVARKLNVSTGTVSELLAIGTNLQEPLLTFFKEGRIQKTVAVEMSKLEKNQQEEIASQIEGENIEFSVKMIKAMRKEKAAMGAEQERMTSAPEREPSSEPKQEDSAAVFENAEEWNPNSGWQPMSSQWNKMVEEAEKNGILNAAPCVICHNGTMCQGCCRKCNHNTSCGMSQYNHGSCAKLDAEAQKEENVKTHGVENNICTEAEGEKGQEKAKEEKTEIVPQRNYELEVAQVKIKQAITHLVAGCKDIKENGGCEHCPIFQNGNCIVGAPDNSWLSNLYA